MARSTQARRELIAWLRLTFRYGQLLTGAAFAAGQHAGADVGQVADDSRAAVGV